MAATGGGHRTVGTSTPHLAVRARRGLHGAAAAAYFASLVLPVAAADGDVSQGAPAGPVPTAGLAYVAWLREAVIVIIAEFCVGGMATWAFQCSLRLRPVGHPCSLCYPFPPD